LAENRNTVRVPQKTFVWSVEEGMRTWMMLKDLKLNEDEMKGTLDEEGYLYPFGYQE